MKNLNFYSLDSSGNQLLRMMVDISGNVGIGTTTPNGLFVTSGSGKIELETSDTTDGIKIGTLSSSVPISIGNTTSEVIVNDNFTVTGDITINGTNTSINSDNVIIKDPILSIGEQSPTSSDLKDKGIEFKYYDSTAKTGFMGFDYSAKKQIRQ